MPRPRPLDPTEAKNTLAHRLAGRVDRLRQFSTRFGLRSTRVFLVWTKYTGEERGEGNENELARVEILPTPFVSDESAIVRNPYSAGMLPNGVLRVSRISARFTADHLSGVRIPQYVDPGECGGSGEITNLSDEPSGADFNIDQPYDFFYELSEDGRGANPSERERFRIYGGPARNEGGVEWIVTIERISEDFKRDGTSDYGGG